MIDRVFSYLSQYGIGFMFNTGTILVSVVLIFLLIFFLATQKLVKPLLRSYRLAKKSEDIATNSKPHWFFGHSRYFGSKPHERVENICTKMSLHHPTLYNFWRGPVWAILQIFHPDLAKAFFSSGAPKDEFTYGGMRPWIGDGLLTSKGEKWKRQRLLLTPAFHFSVLKPYMKISNQTSKVLVKKWKQKMEQPLEIGDDVSMLTLDTMLQCAMSTKSDCQFAEGCHPYVKAIQDVAKAFGARFRNPFLIIDWIFRLTKNGKIFYSGIDVLHSYTEKVIFDRREILKQTQSTEDKSKSKKSRDFLDILLETKDETGKGLTKQEIRDEVDTFLFEGHDTTSSGITWAIYNLAKYPEFQEKCREEVQSICRDQEDVEWEDLSLMTYLTMFLKESMRLYPPVFSIARQVERPLTIKCELNSPKEYTIPAGSKIGMHIMSMHRNPVVWENPLEFDPERFTKENCAARPSHAYVPFAAGSRNCIGQNFAMNEMKVALSQILRNFKLYLDEETPEPKMEFRVILQSEDGVYIKLKPLDN